MGRLERFTLNVTGWGLFLLMVFTMSYAGFFIMFKLAEILAAFMGV